MKLKDTSHLTDTFSSYQSFIYKSRYARWIDTSKGLTESGRREFWDETVDRYLTFMMEHIDSLEHSVTNDTLIDTFDDLYNMIWDQ